MKQWNIVLSVCFLDDPYPSAGSSTSLRYAQGEWKVIAHAEPFDKLRTDYAATAELKQVKNG